MDQAVSTDHSDRYASLIAALAAVNSEPLWDRYARMTPRQPSVALTVCHWPWATMEALIERAAREVAMEDAERRVLLLANPAFPETATATTNLSAGLQTLLPGETARAHRHTLQAIRFVMQGSGAVTSVNDERCPMAEGDLVLTPSWTWHAHAHEGIGRVVWFDGLDLPLCRHLDTVFLQVGKADQDSVEPPATRASALQSAAVALLPDAFDPRGEGPGSRFKYARKRAWQVLLDAAPAADGSRLLRYVHGESGGAVLPTLDCYLLACASGRPTRSARSTSNAVCVVAQGQGSSRVGEQTVHWRQRDVFTLPHWQWVSHSASKDAVIFMMTDRELLASIGYLRDEEQA